MFTTIFPQNKVIMPQNNNSKFQAPHILRYFQFSTSSLLKKTKNLARCWRNKGPKYTFVKGNKD